MCRRRGAVVASVSLENLKVKKGGDVLSVYQFNTRMAKHFFCSNCGIYTHHQRRSNPDEYGFNVSCIEEIDISKIENILLYDGVNHPSDAKG